MNVYIYNTNCVSLKHRYINLLLYIYTFINVHFRKPGPPVAIPALCNSPEQSCNVYIYIYTCIHTNTKLYE